MTERDNNSDLMIIYEGNSIESEMVKEILQDHGIIVNIKNQLMGTIAPWQVSAGGFDPIKLEIFVKDKEKALRLIEEFNSSND